MGVQLSLPDEGSFPLAVQPQGPLLGCVVALLPISCGPSALSPTVAALVDTAPNSRVFYAIPAGVRWCLTVAFIGSPW